MCACAARGRVNTMVVFSFVFHLCQKNALFVLHELNLLHESEIYIKEIRSSLRAYCKESRKAGVSSILKVASSAVDLS